MKIKNSQKNKFANRCRGFTLIELLVVVAIIGLLSSIVLTSLQEARQRAKVSRVVSDFRQMEVAFKLMINTSNRSAWWQSSEFSSCPDTWQVPISCIIDNYGLDMPEEPEPVIGTYYTYHNSNGTYSCGNSCVWCGVNVSLRGVPISSGFVQDLDQMIDGGDGDKCGRIKWNQSGGAPEYSLYWMLAEDSGDY